MKKFFTSKYHILLDLIISIIIIGGLLYFAGVQEFLGYIAAIDIWWLAFSIILLFIMYLLMVLRIKILLDDMKAPLGFWKIFRAHLTGMLLADFTPARSGYVASAAVMRNKYKIPSEKAMVSILGPQMFDFMLKLAAGAFAVFYLLSEVVQGDSGWVLYIGVAGLAGVLATLMLLLFSRRFLNMFSFCQSLPVVGSFAGRIYAMFHRMQDNSHSIIRKTPHILAILLFTWTFKALSWWAAAKAVGITVEFPVSGILFFFLFQPLVTMLEFIPTPTLAGMGLSETGGVLAMGVMGVGAAQATAFMLVARFKTILMNLPGYRYALQSLDF